MFSIMTFDQFKEWNGVGNANKNRIEKEANEFCYGFKSFIDITSKVDAIYFQLTSL